MHLDGIRVSAVRQALGLIVLAAGCQGQPPRAQSDPQTVPVVGELPAPRAAAPDDRTLAPYFFVASDDPAADPLPLESTRADVHIAGAIADVRVTQVYKNQGARPLEAIYVFPMSTRAAVHGLKMTVGERTTLAEIHERAQARATYEAARNQGRTASLLEQDRPNVFRMNVANILPGERIRVELSYVELIVPSEHLYEFVFPTVVGPRYSTTVESQAAPPDRSTKTPYLHAGVPAAHTFALEALVESPVLIRQIGASSHAARIEFPTGWQARVTLPEGDDAGNRDFILRWTLEGPAIASGLLLGRSEGENYFLLAMEPPARVETAAIVPREYLFVVDVSGSMNGFPLDTAKTLMRNLLGGLRAEDRFNILSFSGGSELFAPASQPADAEHVRSASQFMEHMEAGGGTELLPSLERALALPRTDAARVVVLVTDGYVNVEKQSFELVRRSLGQANFFAFGIGSSVNRFLIEGLARAGEGEPFVVTKPDEAADAAKRFQSYVRAPILRNVHVELDGFDAYDLEPASLPDLFAERPIVVHGRFRGEPAGRVIITGRVAGGAFAQTIDVAGATRLADGAALRLLWARERLTWLEDLSGAGDRGALEDEITKLGLAHRLMTPYTSFVAVDKTPRAAGRPVTVEQPQPMPAGVSDDAVQGTSHLASIFGRDSRLGGDAQDVLGGLVGTDVGEAYGIGGLGLVGSGKGGGGTGEGTIGLGNLGTLGKMGSGARRAHAPGVMLGAGQVRGSLDREIIRRVIRSHLNEVKFCYEKELMKKAELFGRVLIQFTISRSGQVVASTVQNSTMNDSAVEQCIATAVRRWEFPKPQGGGVVIVTYPFSFNIGRTE